MGDNIPPNNGAVLRRRIGEANSRSACRVLAIDNSGRPCNYMMYYQQMAEFNRKFGGYYEKDGIDIRYIYSRYWMLRQLK